MDAQVVLKASPQEFDTIRAALQVMVDQSAARGDDKVLPPAERQAAKRDALRASDLIRKLS
jgi:hypothetical protein